jgi:hypothetical protein
LIVGECVSGMPVAVVLRIADVGECPASSDQRCWVRMTLVVGVEVAGADAGVVVVG